MATEHNTLSFFFEDANVLIGRMKNVAVSNGSACTSAVVEPFHVLVSMVLGDDDAFASIRFSRAALLLYRSSEK